MSTPCASKNEVRALIGAGALLAVATIAGFLMWAGMPDKVEHRVTFERERSAAGRLVAGGADVAALPLSWSQNEFEAYADPSLAAPEWPPAVAAGYRIADSGGGGSAATRVDRQLQAPVDDPAGDWLLHVAVQRGEKVRTFCVPLRAVGPDGAPMQFDAHGSLMARFRTVEHVTHIVAAPEPDPPSLQISTADGAPGDVFLDGVLVGTTPFEARATASAEAPTLDGVQWRERREHLGWVLEYALAPPGSLADDPAAYVVQLQTVAGKFRESYRHRIEVRAADGTRLELDPDRITFDPIPRGQLTLLFE